MINKDNWWTEIVKNARLPVFLGRGVSPQQNSYETVFHVKLFLLAYSCIIFFFFLPAENMSRIICETDDDSNKNEKTSGKFWLIGRS